MRKRREGEKEKVNKRRTQGGDKKKRGKMRLVDYKESEKENM